MRGLPSEPEVQSGQWVYHPNAMTGLDPSLQRTTPGEAMSDLGCSGDDVGDVMDVSCLGDNFASVLEVSAQTPHVIPLYPALARDDLKSRRVGNRKIVKPCIHYLKHIVLFRAQLFCGLELRNST